MNPLLSGKECDVLCIQEKFPFVNEIRKIYLFIVWMYLLSTANLFQKNLYFNIFTCMSDLMLHCFVCLFSITDLETTHSKTNLCHSFCSKSFKEGT